MQVINNTLLESAGIATKSCDEKFNLCNEGVNPFNLYNGPMNSAVVIRNNVMERGEGISVDGTTSGAVVEGNILRNGSSSFATSPVNVANTTEHIFTRGNILMTATN